MRVSAIIPAYNESARIADTVRAALALPGVVELVVVDDGSTDDTAARARDAGATHVIRLARNEGKGGAMNRGWKAASEETLLFLDGDLGASASEASKLLEPLAAGTADVALARFPETGRKAGFGFVMRLARWGVRRLTGREITAPLSGQRAMRKEAIARIGGFSPGFSVETAMTIDLLRAGCRIVEIPTEMTHHSTGRNFVGFRHRGRQFLHVAAALLVRVRPGSRP